MNEPVRNCSTCAHRRGWVAEFYKCDRTTYFCSTMRGGHAQCDKNFSGWVQRDTFILKLKRMLPKVWHWIRWADSFGGYQP